MKKVNYACLMKQAKKEIDTLIKNSNDLYKRQATLVSASLTNYFPAVQTNDHFAVFEKVLFTQRLSFLEQFQPGILTMVQLAGISLPDLLQLKSAPKIICTFHYGSYRLINMLLAKNAIPFALVVSSSVIARQGAGIANLFASYSSSADSSNFKIIDAEAATSVLQMLRALKLGYSLIVYIDGNTGAGDPTFTSTNCLSIPFLAKQIKARKGVATLSHITNISILPLVSYWEKTGKSVLQFGPIIDPSHYKDRTQYVYQATTRLFSFITGYLKRDPGQWESLLYLHKFTMLESAASNVQARTKYKSDGLFKFNGRDFGLFTLGGKYILLMKQNYISFLIPHATYTFLQRSDQQVIKASEVTLPQFNDLVKAGVLINT